MGRPNTQEAKRAELIGACRAAIMERGMTGLRLRDVAERAGMSASSIFYYYPALTDLLREVEREAVDRFCAARAEANAVMSADQTDPRQRLVATMRGGLPSGPDDELCHLLYELGSVARRDASHAARHIALYERQVAIYVGILEAGAASGVFRLADDAVTIARNLVILEDGYGLHAVMAVPTFDISTAERLMRSYAAMATGCDLSAF
jgi:AcrR family transcriptional regulator